MIVSRVSVQRPVFAIMISAAILVVGWFSYRQLGLDLMPKTDVPVVNVQVQLPGASAEEIETQLTKPLEEAVNLGKDGCKLGLKFGLCSLVIFVGKLAHAIFELKIAQIFVD